MRTWIVWVGLASVGALLAIGVVTMWLLPVFSFPQPSGPFQIGTIRVEWTDPNRAELFLPDRDRPRSIVSQIYYPSAPSQGEAAPYVPPQSRVPQRIADLMHLPSFLLEQLRRVQTHAKVGAPVSAQRERYPVLIYLSGLGGFSNLNTFEAEELASNGFVVVALDQPGGAASVTLVDGTEIAGLGKAVMDPLLIQSARPASRAPQLFGIFYPQGLVPYFAEDVSLALDQLGLMNASGGGSVLGGKLDLQHVGIYGVSLGGIVAAQACHTDQRILACIVMDAFMTADVATDGLSQPAMWLTRSAEVMRAERDRAGGWTEDDIALHIGSMSDAFSHSGTDAYYVEIADIFHLDFTDAPLWSPIVSWLGLSGPIGVSRAHAIINSLSLAFFDRYVSENPSRSVADLLASVPEVRARISPSD